jgi:hypothetical protein
LRLIHTPTLAVTFGAEPQSITITAYPAATVDAQAIGTFDGLPFELIEQDEIVHCPVMSRVTLHVWERRLPGLVGHGRDERRQLARLLGRLGRRRAGLGLFQLVARVRVGLRKRRSNGREQETSDGCSKTEVSPRCHSSTRTSRNMPDSMWKNRWQWYAQRPSASARTR